MSDNAATKIAAIRAVHEALLNANLEAPQSCYTQAVTAVEVMLSAGWKPPTTRP